MNVLSGVRPGRPGVGLPCAALRYSRKTAGFPELPPEVEGFVSGALIII